MKRFGVGVILVVAILLGLSRTPCIASDPGDDNVVLSPVSLARLLLRYGAQSHPETLAAIIAHESSAHVYAFHDNNTRIGHTDLSRDEAIAEAETLVAEGHSVDLGLGEINSSNLPGLHTRGLIPGRTMADWVRAVFDPAINITCGDYILHSAWNTAQRYFGTAYAAAHPHDVVRYAISVYNSNTLFHAPVYVESVVAETQSRFVRETVADAYAVRAPVAMAHVAAMVVSTPPPYDVIHGWLTASMSQHRPKPRVIVPAAYSPGGKP